MSKFLPSSEAKLAGASLGNMPRVFLEGNSIKLARQPGGRTDEDLIIDHVPVESVRDLNDADMLRLANQCFDAAENYFNASHRTRIMDAMSRFRSMHPRGSKYWNEAYSKRSRTFRPKTRSTVRKREAAAVTAMFSTADVANISANDNGNAAAAKDARIQSALLNHRLNEDARWYQFVVGAMQDADRQGCVIACTGWEYAESNRYFDEQAADSQGNIQRQKHRITMPLMDRPDARLIPIENCRWSPAAKWTDVVGTSPYFIELMPMYIEEIRRYQNNPRARLKYRNLSDAELMSGTHSVEYDPIRMQREGNRQDRYSHQGEVNEYSVVWVHRNIVRIEGEDYVYDTVGTNVMLSDVVPLAQLDPRGYRPYKVGCAILESHNPYPEGAVTLMGPLQDEINDMANLRVDMTKMATSGRMFVSRSAGVDLARLARFSPGAAVEVNNAASDVRWEMPRNPPQSNFEENNLLNIETDDLIGNFNQGSVAANKQMNETVGGMAMLADTGSQLNEYDLRTLAFTFFEPVLRQYLDLIRIYETDRTLAALIGSKFAISEREYWNALQTPTTLRIDVGYAATNPMKRLERLTVGLKTMAEFFPYAMMFADQAEIGAEIMGACGYADADRFFPFMDQKAMEDPKYRALILQMNQLRMLSFPHIAEAQGRQQQGEAQARGAVQAAQVRAQAQLEQARLQESNKIKLLEMQLEQAKLQLRLQQETNAMRRDELMMQREKLAADIANQQETLALKAQEMVLHEVNLPGMLTPEQNAEIRHLGGAGGQELPASSAPGLPMPSSNDLTNSVKSMPSNQPPRKDDDDLTAGDFSGGNADVGRLIGSAA